MIHPNAARAWGRRRPGGWDALRAGASGGGEQRGGAACERGERAHPSGLMAVGGRLQRPTVGTCSAHGARAGDFARAGPGRLPQLKVAPRWGGWRVPSRATCGSSCELAGPSA